MKTFIKTEISDEIEQILKKGLFFPVIISGPTGCGKTYPVIKLCEDLKRDLAVINITNLSDESSLMGSVQLENGNTYYKEGPVLSAMRKGQVLLLDEFDLATPENIMCLQTVLDGGDYFVKYTGETVKPVDGFTVIATANTKGLGDDTGTYIGTNVLNEAFLERFIINYVIDYMHEDEEVEVLKSTSQELNAGASENWIKKLVEWANEIRSSKDKTDISHTISTRRLVQILKTYTIFNNQTASVAKCLKRFDEHHQNAFMRIYETLIEPDEKKTATGDMIYTFQSAYLRNFENLNINDG